MKSSYRKEDVEILLKDITGLVEPLDTKSRETLIQSGIHYSQMLPLEYKPSTEYLSLYKDALVKYAKITAEAVAVVSEKIYILKGKTITLVSLARAGTPVGILIKRYLEKKYKNINVKHYTISIIRGIGVDENAMNYILKFNKPESIQFVDGWIGKGAILKTLKRELDKFKGVSPELAVLADPAKLTTLYGTQEDFLIASSCLNSTVSGLMSRTFLRDDIISKNDFHGAAFYSELKDEDLSYQFIETIVSQMEFKDVKLDDESIESDITGYDEVLKIQKDFNVDDINFIKPGIGETTRVLLRRVPFKVLINDFEDVDDLRHIIRLAKEKNVEIVKYPMSCYKACGIIKDMADA